MTTYLPKVLVTGGNGQVASAIATHALAKDFQLVLCNKEECDIERPASISQAISKHLPDIIINTAAYTAVDDAEEHVSEADRTNHIGAGQLGVICHKNQIKLFQLSTDYIFDGTSQQEYTEEDKANPINTYGNTKWLGEQAIRENCNNHVILRVCAVFSEYGHNFLKTMLKLANERPTLRVVSDQTVCPTYAGDIAGALLTMAKQPSVKGTFHFASSEPISWHGFANAIITEAGKYQTLTAKEVKAIASSDYPTPAKRPKLSIFNCEKIKDTYDIDQPSWRTAIKEIIPKLIQEKA